MSWVKRTGEGIHRIFRDVAGSGRFFFQKRRKSDMEPKPFNLLGWFSLLSPACIVLLSTALAIILSRFMTNAMVERDTAISAQFVEGFTSAKPVFFLVGRG